MEYNRFYDKISNSTWVEHECPKCHSKNITPIGKRQVGKESRCYYICEECKEEFGEVVYAINGKER